MCDEPSCAFSLVLSGLCLRERKRERERHLANYPNNSALGLAPDSPSELSSIVAAVDPTSTGFVTYDAFVSVAAAKLHMRDEDAVDAEVDAAYRLFTLGSDGPITLQHLRRIARDLKEDNVGDDLLKDMIREANGGDGLQKGVTLDQFRDVMSRAGVF